MMIIDNQKDLLNTILLHKCVPDVFKKNLLKTDLKIRKTSKINLFYIDNLIDYKFSHY